MKFDDPRLAVFVCSHIFRNERPINLVSHQSGDWQLMCGLADHETKDGHVVGIGHLLGRDGTLHEVADLPVDWEAEREKPGSPWLKTRCDLDT